MKIIIVKNHEEASQKAFEIMKSFIDKDQPILGLATGSTPVRLYELLIEDHQKNHTSYKDVVTFNLDEYYGLPEGHPQTYRYFMDHQLFDHIDINKANTNIPSSLGDAEVICKEYSKNLHAHQVDIQLLGLGSNGHIGFNEPGTSFESTTQLVDLTENTILDNARLFFDGNIDEVPKKAITMGIKDIMNAKSILLIATGENKADAVKGMIEDQPTTDLPASALQMHNDVTIIIDEAAASKLTK